VLLDQLRRDLLEHLSHARVRFRTHLRHYRYFMLGCKLMGLLQRYNYFFGLVSLVSNYCND
jgi:hypothetical protein